MGPKKTRVKQDARFGGNEPCTYGAKGFPEEETKAENPASSITAIPVQQPAPLSTAVPSTAPSRSITKKHVTREIELDVVYNGVTPKDPSLSKSLSRRTSLDSLCQYHAPAYVPGELAFGTGQALPGFDSEARLQPGDEAGIGCSPSSLLPTVVRIVPRDVDRSWEFVLGDSEAVRVWEQPSQELQSVLGPNWKEELSAKATKVSNRLSVTLFPWRFLISYSFQTLAHNVSHTCII